MRVLKFGGTSVANADCFENVAEIAVDSASREQIALVLSAPAKITNLLVALVQQAQLGESGETQFKAIAEIVKPIITTLGSRYPEYRMDAVMQEYESIISLIEKRVQGIVLLGQCPERVMAFVESRGEAFSIAIMQELLRIKGKRVAVLDPVKTLITEGKVMESSVVIEKSRTLYAQHKVMDDKAVLLMAGFSGGDEHGELVLLGRNGSDYSAACLAAIIDADYCEIWTDVDGVYSCDPRLVHDAVLLKQLSYQEAMELSYFGAKVLHPRTITPIAQFQIPCLIKNTKNPRAEGTLISSDIDPQVPIKGISDLKDIALLNISGPGMKGMVGMAGRLFTAVSRSNISIVLITQSSSEYSISFCIRQSDLESCLEAITEEFRLELKEGVLEPIQVKENCAIISVVGDGMRTMAGTSGRFFRAFAEANINVNAIAQGSSERSISAVIAMDKVAEAIAVTHMAFFNSLQVLDLVIVGVGGIGSELIRQIRHQGDELRKLHGIDIRVVGLANLNHFLTNSQGIDLSSYKEELEQTDAAPFTLDACRHLVADSHLVNPVFVDCTSDEGIAMLYCDLMQLGMHVVTPSKKANTSSIEYYRKLRKTARRYHRKFLYEANVGAGLPVINTLQNELAAGDKLIEFSGIMSGTLSYIFGLVEDGYTLSQATVDAYEKGFSEPNPRDDLEGMDVARKTLILARECGYALELEDIKVESAVNPDFMKGSTAREVLDNLKEADAQFSARVSQARAEGKVLRYVATILQDGQCSCGVRAVDATNPLFKVRDGENALALTTAYYQPIPLVIRGYGAGKEVTAAGVLADILRLQNWTREG
ncbi:MAG: bifunctional aspartate kinase/homoserine dehydrogenase I [Succinivibrio sp.]|nr:bifunctional aspartate kinase/homoserine dehydrogenase I [Succinivibrio sp.]